MLCESAAGSEADRAPQPQPHPPDHTRRRTGEPFDRLSATRRSLSSPSVAAAHHSSHSSNFAKNCVATPTGYEFKAEDGSTGKLLEEEPKKAQRRRRTALGLISAVGHLPRCIGGGGSGGTTSGATSTSQTGGWRAWLAGESPSRAQSKLLRNQQQQQQHKLIRRQTADGSVLQQVPLDSHSHSHSHSQSQQQPQQQSSITEEPSKLTFERCAKGVRPEVESNGPKEKEDASKHKQAMAPNSHGNSKPSLMQKIARVASSASSNPHHLSQQTRAQTATTTTTTVPKPKQAQMVATSNPPSPSELVERLIDSPLEWRQVIRECAPEVNQLERVLSETQIKRQEVIHELVQTERHHCLTLALMRQVYLAGLRQMNELRVKQQPHWLVASTDAAGSGSADPVDLERLFPALDELIQAHELFFAHLRLRLLDCCQVSGGGSADLRGVVGPIGDLLADQFRLAGSPLEDRDRTRSHKNAPDSTSPNKKEPTGNGNRLLQAYARFCGQHYDSSRYYKQLMQCDKGFQHFIEQCQRENGACKQRGIPECNLLVAQRLTKYPLLIEQLIKSSKDEDPREQRALVDAMKECKSLLSELNNQLARKESFERLLDIYAQFSPKSYTLVCGVVSPHHSALDSDLVCCGGGSSSNSNNNNNNNGHCSDEDCDQESLPTTKGRLEPSGRHACSVARCHLVRFTKHDLLQHKRLRQLLHSDAQVQIWSATRRKLFQVLCLILNDIVVFLRVEPASCAAPTSGPSSSAAQAGDEQSSQALQLQLQQGEQQVSGEQQTGSVELGAEQSNRYHFANIDNKPSVISLGKLLIREKAVEEREPRVYLISSSPRQPEMYELAFASRRHQQTFIGKLKDSIEQFNRSSLVADEQSVSGFACCDDEDAAFDGDELFEEDDILGANLDAADECYVADVDCEDALCERKDAAEQQCTCDASANRPADNSRRKSTIGLARKRTKNGLRLAMAALQPTRAIKSSGSTKKTTNLDGKVTDEDELDDALDDERACARLPFRSTSSPTISASKRRGRRRRKSVVDDDNGDAREEHLDLDDCNDFKVDIETNIVNEPPVDSDATNEVGATNEDDEEDFEEETGSSGLSERARDSLDESLGHSMTTMSSETDKSADARQQDDAKIATTTITTTPGGGVRQRIRANRRRRAQRPRQVSNQSSTSSSSTAADTTASAISAALAAAASKCGAPAKPEVVGDEEFDSGRGHDSSSSSSSTSSRLANAPATADAPDAATGSAVNEAAPGKTEKEADADRSQASEGPSRLMVMPQAAPSSAAIAAAKQRKLSSVSTMSSQLKLLARLRSGEQLSCPHCCATSGRMQISPTNNGLDAQQQLRMQHEQSSLSRLVRQKMRRASFIPEQKLEELRDLRIQLDKDKQEWQTKFDRMQEQLLNERRELDLAREQLRQDRQQVANEREQLYRKLDLLKEKGILLSPSHKVIITAPELRLMQHQHQPQQASTIYSNNLIYQHQQQQQHYNNHPYFVHSQMQQQHQLLLPEASSVASTAMSQAGSTSSFRVCPLPLSSNKQVNVIQQQQQLVHKQASRVPLHLSQQQPQQQQQQQSGSSQLASVAGKIAASIPFIGNHV